MKKQLFEIVKECARLKDSSEAFRLIVQGAVKVNGELENYPFKELTGGEKNKIQVGRKHEVIF